MANAVVGIDVSQLTFDVAILNAGRYECFQLKNNKSGYRELLKRLDGLDAQACLEATALYWVPIANALYHARQPVSVENPLRIQRYGQSKLRKNKTDKADAKLIAEFCLKEQPRLWQPQPAEYVELRELFRRREQLLKACLAETNRLKAGFSSKAMLESIRRMIQQLRSEIARVDKLMRAHIRSHQSLKSAFELLVTIPGVGPLTAMGILAELGDLGRFDNAKQVAAFAGLTPKEHQSGTSVNGPTGISKLGSPHLRRLLYMPAVVARAHNPIVKAMCETLLAKGKQKMTVVVAAMRKLLHIAFGVLRNQTPFQASPS